MKNFRNILMGLMLTISIMICGNAYANETTNSIDTLMINVPSEIHIYKTDDFGINVQTPNKYLYDNVKWELKNNMLIINFDDNYMIKDQIINSNDIKINIGLPNKIKCIQTNSNLQIAKTTI